MNKPELDILREDDERNQAKGCESGPPFKNNRADETEENVATDDEDMRHEEFLKAEEIFAVDSDIRGYFFRVVVLVLEPADWHINHLPVYFHPDLLN